MANNQVFFSLYEGDPDAMTHEEKQSYFKNLRARTTVSHNPTSGIDYVVTEEEDQQQSLKKSPYYKPQHEFDINGRDIPVNSYTVTDYYPKTPRDPNSQFVHNQPLDLTDDSYPQYEITEEGAGLTGFHYSPGSPIASSNQTLCEKAYSKTNSNSGGCWLFSCFGKSTTDDEDPDFRTSCCLFDFCWCCVYWSCCGCLCCCFPCCVAPSLPSGSAMSSSKNPFRPSNEELRKSIMEMRSIVDKADRGGKYEVDIVSAALAFELSTSPKKGIPFCDSVRTRIQVAAMGPIKHVELVVKVRDPANPDRILTKSWNVTAKYDVQFTDIPDPDVVFDQRWTLVHIPVDKYRMLKLQEFCVEQNGKKFDAFGMWWNFVPFIDSIREKWFTDHPMTAQVEYNDQGNAVRIVEDSAYSRNPDKKWFCSEFVMAALAVSYPEIWGGYRPAFATPGMIYTLAKAKWGNVQDVSIQTRQTFTVTNTHEEEEEEVMDVNFDQQFNGAGIEYSGQ